MTQEKNETVMNPKIVGEMELPKIDLKKYEGQKTVIGEIEYREHIQHGLYILLKTTPLEGSTEDKPVYATRVLGLIAQKDDKGETTGYGWGAETKTGLFLRKMGVEHTKDLIGKEVIVRFEINKSGKEVLTF